MPAPGIVHAIFIAALAIFSAGASSSAFAANAIRVIDGDTFVLNGEHIRILAIDAPERGRHARCAYERELAERASAALQSLLERHPLRVERRALDVYGRTLARVSAGGVDVGQELRRRGLASRWEGQHHRWCR